MIKKTLNIHYQHFKCQSDLSSQQQILLESAKEAAQKAHAIYSKFRVGAALLLEDSQVLKANNQENASYPAGLCAERVLLSYVHANFPNKIIQALAIYGLDTKRFLSPCGLCRQSILEYNNQQEPNIQILITNGKEVLVFESIKDLLPFAFDQSFL